MDFFRSARFDTRVQQLMAKLHIPGLSIAIIHGEETASRAFGVACTSSSKPCTPDTLFNIASSSKVLTAASIALLVQDANHPDLTFTTPVSRLLPDDFVLPIEEYTRNVTIDDLLGHRTGMARHDSSYLGVHAARPDDARSVTRNLRNLQICAPLRTKYVYCNMMYTAATHLIETQTGLSFSDFLEAHFFEPLGMSSSSLQPSLSRRRGLGQHIALGHMWDETEGLYREFPTVDAPEAQGAGCVVTSVEDYIKLVRALMRREAPISQQVYDGLTMIRSFPDPTPHSSLDAVKSPSFYCAGLEVTYNRGHTVIGHNGRIAGFGSHFFFIPSLDFGCVMMGNATETALLAVALEQELIDSIVLNSNGSSLPSQEMNVPPFGERCSRQPRARLRAKEAEPQKMPLSVYIGQYWNPGYRGLEIQIRDSALFIDATDRSSAVELTLCHVSDQTQYLANVHLGKALGGMQNVSQMRAEFIFENDRAVKFGLAIEENLAELIWFDRIHDDASAYVFI